MSAAAAVVVFAGSHSLADRSPVVRFARFSVAAVSPAHLGIKMIEVAAAGRAGRRVRPPGGVGAVSFGSTPRGAACLPGGPARAGDAWRGGV